MCLSVRGCLLRQICYNINENGGPSPSRKNFGFNSPHLYKGELGNENRAGIAQVVEHQLPKLRVAGSSPVSRSKVWRL